MTEAVFDRSGILATTLTDECCIADSIIAIEQNDVLENEDQRVNDLGFIKRNKGKLLLSAAALSMGYTAATGGYSETKDDIVEAAPWVASGVAASEIIFVGGAVIMASSAAVEVKSPLQIRKQMPEIINNLNDSRKFKTGFWVNATGAIGTTAVFSAGVVSELPPSSWGVLGLSLGDVAGTVALRKYMLDKMDENTEIKETAEPVIGKATVRNATLEDADRLVEIDLARFKKAYGDDLPDIEELRESFTKRISNAGEWMYLVEVEDKVEGFVTAFKTNKPIEEFTSWEESTNNGTLDGCVDEDGKYVYIANLTMNPPAMKSGGETMAVANLFANAIRDNVEYGYFISRMPLFARWVSIRLKNGDLDESMLSDTVKMQEVAEEYVNLKRNTKDGEARYDYELRMYEESGFELLDVIPEAFQDEASLNYGVISKIGVSSVPGKSLRKYKVARSAMSKIIRRAAKHPKLIEKMGI